jgi:hypothetical protein
MAVGVALEGTERDRVTGMARGSACRAQGKGGFGRSGVSYRQTAQKTPAPLKQVVVLADAGEDIEAARDFYEAADSTLTDQRL